MKSRCTSAQLGESGCLLVRRQLLKLGIDSAPLTTDSGVDLVAYDQKTKQSFSIQVKTRTPARDGMKPGWRIAKRKEKDFDLLALVANDDCWYLTLKDLKDLRFWRNTVNGLSRIWFYIDGGPRRARKASEVAKYKNGDGIARYVNSLKGQAR